MTSTRINYFNYCPLALVIRAGFLIFDLANVLALNCDQSAEVFENVPEMQCQLGCGGKTLVASFLAQCSPGEAKNSWEDLSVLRWLWVHTAFIGGTPDSQ